MSSRPSSHSSSSEDEVEKLTSSIDYEEIKELETFVYTDHKSQNLVDDIDPDNNFFANTNNICSYYTDTQFNRMVNTEHKISIIHFNSRSLYSNFLHIKEYLNHFNTPFNIIAISETWISPDKGMDFDLYGYEMFYMNRKNESGGGVALYIDRKINCKVVDGMSMAVDNVFECVTVEICMEKNKNIIISCIYRAPGSNMEIFKDWMEKMLTKNNQKDIFYLW